MDKEKKKWETPKLICLYRGRPEEAVLGACKYAGQGGPTIAGCLQVEGLKQCVATNKS